MSTLDKRSCVRRVLFLLALLSSPLFCCGSLYVLEALPAALLPSTVDTVMHLFEVEARLENRTGETLYITPISTTYGRPTVIMRMTSYWIRDIPLQPKRSLRLIYDSADMPLAGIAVCRADQDCRFLARELCTTVEGSQVCFIDAIENLPGLEPGWRQAILSYPEYNFMAVLMPILGLLPLALFALYLYIGRLENRQMEGG